MKFNSHRPNYQVNPANSPKPRHSNQVNPANSPKPRHSNQVNPANSSKPRHSNQVNPANSPKPRPVSEKLLPTWIYKANPHNLQKLPCIESLSYQVVLLHL